MTAAPATTVQASRATTSPPSEDLDVPTRRVALEEAFEAVPKHFAQDGDLFASHLLACLSSLFPDGEEFFVRSVRAVRDRIDDPVLKRQVAGFIGQESVHGREHRAFNDHLAGLGYPTQRFERWTLRALKRWERFLPPMANLAATAALEHFTATLGEVVLSDAEVRASIGHPVVQELFVWHALEETEHKAVAFDVLRAVGGSERLRIATMKLVRLGFVAMLTVMLVWSLACDRAAWRPRPLLRSLAGARRSPIADREVWRRLRAYDRVGFHPNDRDTRGLVASWRERLFGERGEMRGRLVAGAA
jgi:predicted metal-dependent hydrolase